MEAPGFEPGAFCMQSRRDTTTPRPHCTYFRLLKPLTSLCKLSAVGELTRCESATLIEGALAGWPSGLRRWL